MPRKYKGYAAGTTVPVNRTKSEIEKLVTEKYKATSYGSFVSGSEARIMFALEGRNIMFRISIPESVQMERTRWRALLLVIKAKLESVASEIETIEEAFLSQVMAPDGKTYGEHVVPNIATDYAERNVPLLPKF